MPGPKDVLVTTTSTLQNIDIKKYLKPVSSQIVIGAGFFSDFGAVLTDLLGGRSESYQRRLTSLYDASIAQLKAAAFELGANCVVGLGVDIDEISGKGKEMFMISAVGTAVVIDTATPAGPVVNLKEKAEVVSVEKLSLLSRKNKILENAGKEDSKLSSESWDFITENQVEEAFDVVLREFGEALKTEEVMTVETKKRAIGYICNLPEETKIELIYGAICKEENDVLAAKLCRIIKDLHLLDFEKMDMVLMSEDFRKKKRALWLLRADKGFYNREDVVRFERLIETINNGFPERATRSTKKQLLSSKQKDIWICECGKSNDVSDKYCSSCGSDTYGFKSGDVTPGEAIDMIEKRIALLYELIDMA